MASLGELFVKVGADVSAFKTDMAEVNTSLKNLNRDAKASTSGFAALGTSLTSVGLGLTAAITTPILGASAAALSFYGNFEETMNKVSALGDITGPSLQRLGSLAMQLGADTKFSAQEAAAGMAELAAKGFDTNQIYQAMPGIMALAATDQMSVGAAAKIASAAMVQFGLDSTQVQHVADALALASKESASSVTTLGSAMEFVGPVAHSAGLSFDQTAAALGILSNAGLDGEKAGTGLRGALAALVNPSSDAAATLKQLGVETTTSSGAMLPFPQILTDLGNAGMTTQQAFNIFGREAASAALVLTEQGGPALTAFTDKLINSDGEAKKTAATMQQGFNGAMEQLKGSVETAGIALGNVLAPAITSFVNIAKGAADSLTTFATWFKDLPTPIQNISIGIVALVAAIGPLVLIAGTLITAWATVAPMLAGIGTAAATLASALGLGGGLMAALSAIAPVVAALALAFAGWKLGEWAYTHLQPFKDMIDGLWGIISNVASIITNVFIIAWNLLTAAISGAWEIGKSFVLWLSDLSIVDTVMEGIKNAVSGAFTVLGNVFASISEKLGWVKNALSVFAGTDAPEAITATNNLKIGADGLAIAYGSVETKTKDTASETKKGTVAFQDHAAELKNAKTEAEELAKQNTLMESNLRASRTAALASNTEWLAMALAVKAVADRKGELIQSIAKLKFEITSGNTTVQAMNDLLTSTEAITAKFAETAKGVPDKVIPAWLSLEAATASAKAKVESVDAAYATLGINSTAVLNKKKEDARLAYEAIKGSGTASATDIENAYKAMTGIVSTETTTMKTNTTGAFDGLMTDISTKITNFAQDISKSLWEGDLSWGEKGKALLKDLGQLVTTSFIEPAAKALGDFVTGALAELLGGKGFGGIGSVLDSLGEKIKGMFGGGGSSAPGVPSVPGGGGGGSAPGGGAAGGAGGVMDMLGNIGSIGSMISGVIGNFQNAKMETTLNAIEWNTRKSSLHFEHTMDQLLWPFLPKLSDIHDRINEYLVEWRELRDVVVYATQSKLDSLINITSTAMYGAILRTNEILDTRLPNLNAGGEGGMSIVLKVDGRELARAMVNYLDDAGATV